MDPVEIELRMKQNLDAEAQKAKQGVDGLKKSSKQAANAFHGGSTSIKNDFVGIRKKAEEETNRMNSLFKKVGAGMATYFSTMGLINFGKEVANVRGEFQQLEIALNTMLKSRAKADALLSDVVQMAATTPFKLNEVGQGAKQLLAYRIEASKIIPTLKAMGDVAAGLSVPIDRLILNYGQVKTQAKLTGRELRDFNVAGVPLVAELAKNLGKTEDAIGDMVTAGKIGFKDVEKAFVTMTSEGGQFANLMAEQSKSIPGQISNLSDAISQKLNDIGKANQETIGDVISGAKYLVEHYEDILDIVKVLVATYGSYKAALIAVSAAQKASITMGNIKAFFQLAKSIRSAKDAQLAFNLVSKANPYFLLASAIIGVVTALVIFNKTTSKAAEISAEMSENMKVETDEANKLFSAVKKAKEGTDERKKAIEQINGKYGSYLDNMLTEKSTAEDIAKAYDKVKESITNAQLEKAKVKFLEDPKEDLKETSKRIWEELGDWSKELNSEQQGRFNSYVSDILQEIEKGNKTFDLDEIENAFQAAQASKKYDSLEQWRESLRNGESYGKSIFDFKTFGGDIADVEYAGKDFERFSKNVIQAKNDYEEFKKGYIGKPEESNNEDPVLQNINEQIESTRRLINTLKTALTDLRTGKTSSTDYAKDIDETAKSLKAAQEKLELLTGEKKKKSTKTKQYTDQKERDALAKKNRELEIATEQARIDAMKDGIEKTLALNELNHKKRLAQIEGQKVELLRSLQDLEKATWVKNGGKGVFTSKITELPTELNEKFITQTKASIKELENNNATSIKKLLASSEIKGSSVGAILKSVAKTQQEKLTNVGQYEAVQLKELAKKEQSLDADTYKKKKALIDKEVKESKQAIQEETLEALKEIPQKMLNDLFNDFDLSFTNLDHATLGQLSKVADKLEKLSFNKSQLLDLGLDESQITKLESILDKLKTEGASNIQTAEMKNIQEVFGEIGSVMSEAGDEITQAVGQMVTSLSGMLTTLYDSNASGFEKASGIVSLAITAGNELAKIRKDSMNKEVDAQKATNEALAEQLTIEAKINEIRRERAEMELNSSAFLDPSYKQEFSNALQTAKESEQLLNDSLSGLFGSAVFSSKGKAKRRLFGTKTGTYEFTMEQLLGDYVTSYAGEGAGDLLPLLTGSVGGIATGQLFNGGSFQDIIGGLLDPMGVFGGYADSKAQQNALDNLRDSFDDTLTKMGKTSADIADMTAQDWVDFYSIMEEAGHITDEGTKEMVANAKAASEEYAQAMEDMKAVISDVAGQLGDNITDSLVSAFENGTDAAEAFKSSINDVLKAMFMENLRTSMFQSYFDKLQQEMNASMDGGDGDWSDDLTNFFSEIEPAIGQAEEAMKAWDKQMEATGYDGFGSDGRQAQTGGLAQASQDSIDELNGRVMAISGNVYKINEGTMQLINLEQEALLVNRTITAQLDVIAENTAYCRYLQDIDTTLEDIKTKGVKIR